MRKFVEQEDYEKVEKQIQEQGYEKLKRENIEKLIELFKEMLEYKHKTYEENWNFRQWIENMDLHYHFYHESFLDVLSQIESGVIWKDTETYGDDYIEVNDVQKIIALIDLYEELSDEEDGYKNYAEFYKEIDLEEGQTYSDLYKIKKEKFIVLFKDMLDFLGVKYDTDYFDALKCLVQENYPYYMDILIHLDYIMWNPNETYISILTSMDAIYNNLSKNYKNHKKSMKEYKEEQEIDLIEDED